MRKAEIAPWTENWLERYRQEEALLKSIFAGELWDIHHIGSTSVPQIGFAKPIIDILITVGNIANVDGYNGQMVISGYTPRGENGIAGRRYFTKGGDHRTHHVHIYQAGNINIEYHLNVKEYLIHHPGEAKAYGELKLRLAKQTPDDVHAYQDGKEAYCAGLVKEAMQWASGNKNDQ